MDFGQTCLDSGFQCLWIQFDLWISYLWIPDSEVRFSSIRLSEVERKTGAEFDPTIPWDTGSALSFP